MKLNLRQFFLLASLAFFYPAYSQNSLSVNWLTNQPMLDATSDETPTPLGPDSLYFLFYSSDTTINLDPNNFNGNIAEQRSGDSLVAVRRGDFTLPAQVFNFNEDWEGNVLSSSGYFYSVTLDYNDQNIDVNNPSSWDVTIPMGTLAFISDIQGVVPFDDLTAPTDIFANLGGDWPGGGGAPQGSAVVNVVLVPEPGTVMLVLLGSGITFISMRRKRKLRN